MKQDQQVVSREKSTRAFPSSNRTMAMGLSTCTTYGRFHPRGFVYIGMIIHMLERNEYTYIHAYLDDRATP